MTPPLGGALKVSASKGASYDDAYSVRFHRERTVALNGSPFVIAVERAQTGTQCPPTGLKVVVDQP